MMMIMMMIMMMPPLLLSSFTGCGGDGARSRNNSSGEAFTLSSFDYEKLYGDDGDESSFDHLGNEEIE